MSTEDSVRQLLAHQLCGLMFFVAYVRCQVSVTGRKEAVYFLYIPIFTETGGHFLPAYRMHDDNERDSRLHLPLLPLRARLRGDCYPPSALKP